MFSGPPLPLAHDFPLRRLVSLAGCSDEVGVWIRNARLQRCLITAGGRCIAVMLGGDLGALLHCCRRVVVRSHSQALVLGADEIIRWRVLQVITGAPYLPSAERLREIFPEAEMDDVGFHIPVPKCPPEEVLADCLTHGIRVMGSRILYRAPSLRVESIASDCTHTS